MKKRYLAVSGTLAIALLIAASGCSTRETAIERTNAYSSQTTTTAQPAAPFVVTGFRPKTIINYGMTNRDLAVTSLPPGRRAPLKYWPAGK